MKKTFEISQPAVTLALRLLREHASLLREIQLPASAEMTDDVASQIAAEVALQIPMTPEEQTAALTKIMGCGPEDEAVGNKG
jgi:hypothetical protein